MPHPTKNKQQPNNKQWPQSWSYSLRYASTNQMEPEGPDSSLAEMPNYGSLSSGQKKVWQPQYAVVCHSMAAILALTAGAPASDRLLFECGLLQSTGTRMMMFIWLSWECKTVFSEKSQPCSGKQSIIEDRRRSEIDITLNWKRGMVIEKRRRNVRHYNGDGMMTEERWHFGTIALAYMHTPKNCKHTWIGQPYKRLAESSNDANNSCAAWV